MPIYNLGLRYAQPYESGYSIIRRFLIANPSYSYGALNCQLSASKIGFNFLDRIIRLHANKYNLSFADRTNTNIVSQCPECARSYFHSSIFNISWVRTCPIHKVPLTFNCPNCDKPWPDIKDIGKRNCEGCGRPEIDLKKPHQSLKLYLPPTKPLKSYYDLLEKDADKSIRIESNYIYGNYFKPVSTSSKEYFSCQSILSNVLFKKLNKIQKIKEYPTFLINGKLYKELKNPYVGVEQKYKSIKRFKDNSLVKIEVALSALNKIILHLKKHLPIAHKINILDFRFLDMRDLCKLGTVCPYCMALSLWLYNLFYIEENFDDFPSPFCCKQTYPFTCGTTFTPEKWIEMDAIVYKNTDQKYYLNNQALQNLYLRCLLIHFVRLLDYSHFIKRLILKTGRIENDYWCPPYSYGNRVLNSELYYAIKNGDQASIFFFTENPLQEVRIENKKYDLCCTKKEWKNKYQMLMNRRKCEIIIDHRYSLSEFLEINKNLEYYFQAWMSRY